MQSISTPALNVKPSAHAFKKQPTPHFGGTHLYLSTSTWPNAQLALQRRNDYVNAVADVGDQMLAEGITMSPASVRIGQKDGVFRDLFWAVVSAPGDNTPWDLRIKALAKTLKESNCQFIHDGFGYASQQLTQYPDSEAISKVRELHDSQIRRAATEWGPNDNQFTFTLDQIV